MAAVQATWICFFTSFHQRAFSAGHFLDQYLPVFLALHRIIATRVSVLLV